MDYIAHVREADEAEQLVSDHLKECCQLAEGYLSNMALSKTAGLAALVHDMGKYTTAFQTYLREAIANPDRPPKRGSVDHATYGGRLIMDVLHAEQNGIPLVTAELTANAVISHHGYLHDYVSPDIDSPFWKRVREKELPEYEACKERFFGEVMPEDAFVRYCIEAVEEIQELMTAAGPEKRGEWLSLAARMIFSAVIDADRTNTRDFEEAETTDPSYTLPVERFLNNLESRYDSFAGGEYSSVNQARSDMAEACRKYAEKPSGIYTLSIPTGGGKTLASLRYALHHAKKYKKDRIIYVVPFTTIIEQNAAEIRHVLQAEGELLEHHSNVAQGEEESEADDWGAFHRRQKMNLAKDNWDIPVVFTTMVQYLNAFYSYGSKNARRAHNLSNAVVIFDEVQKIPLSCTTLFNQSVQFLRDRAKTSILLCTATQPALDRLTEKIRLTIDGEMIDRSPEKLLPFKRVELIDEATDKQMNTEDLAGMVNSLQSEHKSILVILNTKSVVRRLVDRLKEEGEEVFHLSTAMCPAHRKEKLGTIRSRLEADEPVICVSTQLIEAGVDVDFSCVIRSLAGMDSIAQAAGRCNRHGKSEVKPTYMIHHEEENLQRLPEMKAGAEITRKMLIDFKKQPGYFQHDLLSEKAMTTFFMNYYQQHESQLNYRMPNETKNMTEILFTILNHHPYYVSWKERHKEEPPFVLSYSMKTAAKAFEVIESNTKSVIVPHGKGETIIAELAAGTSLREMEKLLRELQHYAVNVFHGEWKRLVELEAVEAAADGDYYVLKEGFYAEETGLTMDGAGELDFIGY
ncbi:CRISPR-associated helicase/endonuclease Cas3 [Alkalicoccus urumqiensis]|uniref:CRISPR-associated helicase/endonuclease Cas3 n=1 Tax=Alkalicoccus urumqiensis TaxID=1548213 RepID=A0A2P6MLG9_ALKUR|nr:CRISPR-associated helicase/endonuclease Cas3 [Alkalicoccus urumqiensis]PRO67124.1 CRISPR-associated helicase/endonuclease Cas3 [Alkalicoccus urumqiensis]